MHNYKLKRFTYWLVVRVNQSIMSHLEKSWMLITVAAYVYVHKCTKSVK